LSTSTAATFLMSAEGCSVENCNFVTGIDALVTQISITASDCSVERCRLTMATASVQAINGIIIGGTAHNTVISDNEFISTQAGADAGVGVGTTLANIHILRNRFFGDFAVAAINNVTNAWARAIIQQNNFYILGTGKAVVAVASATGIITDCRGQITANIAAGGAMTAAAMLKAENYFQETAGIAASAVVDPAATAIT